ncbi:cdc42 effector protein 4 [Boleophthalmus pectinirostris]|uniref:cdc42 effector protein 4 n=1 Tax=Boleophthalmus pectinirostris TaxID=150288 RepID=UPI000A1C32FA|nr:cdc42 effector protein 4 [Boleophthalmus pectinirostris]XP_055005981.1 cdc42 effector protein 4 [Boleophthalmus pectinirostris]
MPILKQLVSNSHQSKRRSRVDLTAEMISAPLGDFRHTMHVGRGGDAFGDTSFLSTRSGEPPREHETKQSSPGSKPSLLSRTFRSSKRSQSVNRTDNVTAPNSGSAPYVKNAISLPYLNEEASSNGANRMPKSVSSSPMKNVSEIETKPANGAAAMATLDTEFEERNFGELTDLPPSKPKSTAMKHAESMMSFHIDLGPSMLDDILGVMEKKEWEEDDLGFEEDKVSDGRASPSYIPHIDDDDAEVKVPVRPPRSIDNFAIQTRNNINNHDDSYSVSSAESVGNDKRQYIHEDTDSAKYSSPRHGEDGDFTFMDEDDDDEIRV